MKKYILSCGLLLTVLATRAQDSVWMQHKRVVNQPLFTVENPDYTASPFTGMTRKHWKDAALYLLSGAFSYIDSPDDPMQFPKQPGKSYPRNQGGVVTEKLEGLCRTLFVAAPLLKENPELIVHGIKVGDYYRKQLVKLITPGNDSYVKPRSSTTGPTQTLVEFGGLAVSLFTIPEVLWEPLTAEQKETLARTMISYGDGPTVGSNWKFFNIFVLSFFKDKGYTVNEKLLKEYIEKSLEHYRGDGWYNDAPAYDYYSMWAFQMYGTLWAKFFGDKYYPAYAKQFRANFSDLKGNYPYMFSRNGEMIMWGRSIAYRMGAIVPFPLMGLEKDAAVNYGWMRRIASGVLLQFLRNPSFLEDNIPAIGFYGAFEPAVQSYSCRGSVFWMAKAFLGLLVPGESDFWTATENEGAWQKELKKGQVYNKLQDSSHILITDYPNIGAAELRAWCHVKAVGAWEQFRSSENYNRLSYNSAFPWQADGPRGEVAMNYVFLNDKKEWEPARLFTYKKFENGIYYRDVEMETRKNIRLQLADMPLPNGILRVDKNSSDADAAVRLGHYALPAVKGAIKTTTRKVKGYTATIINNGVYQLAMVPLKGWTKTEAVAATGLHPVAQESTVINTAADFKASPKPDQAIYATLLLWKKAGEAWTDNELLPVKKLTVSADAGTVTVILADKSVKQIKY